MKPDLNYKKKATENLEIQERYVPIYHEARILLISPTLEDVAEAKKALRRKGVPANARVNFQQWPEPNTNYYLIAGWYDEEDEDGD